MINKEQLAALRKIIYAVESGGQEYGCQDYGNYTEAYTNSEDEHALTIGAGQWYGTEAWALLQRIKDAGGKGFTKALLKALDEENWATYSPDSNSKIARTITAVLTTDIGKATQDAYMDEQLTAYCNEAKKMGVKDAQAQGMCANFIHQGGVGAASRILDKAGEPYTIDRLYKASKSDTGNQVGTYKARQSFVFYAIKEHFGGPKWNPVTAGDVLRKAESFIGCNMEDGTHQRIIDAYNAYTPRARGYAVSYSDHWCDTFVSAVFILLDAVDLIGGTECGVEEHVKLFKSTGIWIEDGTITPEPGDIIVFNWDDDMQPNDGYADHIGFVERAENGRITTIEGNSGGMVKKNTYPIGDGHIRGFARPKYGTADAEPIKPDLEPGEISTAGDSKEIPEGTENKNPVCDGVVTATALNVRTWAGVEFPLITSVPIIHQGDTVGICGRVLGSEATWYYVRIGKVYGFVHSDYISVT